MECFRLNHFLKIEPGIKPLYRCCHMINAPKFDSLKELENSKWLANTKQLMKNNQWPDECLRCKTAEEVGLESVRVISNKNHQTFKKVLDDYLIVDIVVDTICNAACPICSEEVSSKIAKLKSIPIVKFDGLNFLNDVPKHRVIQIDILGGEPGASKKSKKLLTELEQYNNLKVVHISTNGSTKILEIENLLKKGTRVDLVISMDGTKSVFEYSRFPIKWNKFVDTISYYKTLQEKYANLSLLLWTSISALCLEDLSNMLKFSKEIGIPLNGSPVHFPNEISISRKNFLTVKSKEILLQDDSDFIKKIVSLIATDEEDSSTELLKFLSNNDQIRKTNYKKVFK
jgi:hypothetical protein